MSTARQSPVSDQLRRLLEIRERVGPTPKPGSPADTERQTFPRPESVATAFSQGSIATEAATDHLHALDLLITAGESALAPWTCARGLLEASATATWLLDTRIDATERVGRSMAMRYATLMAQRTLANGDRNVALVSTIDRRIDDVADIAARLGYPAITNRDGRRISIGRQKPTITDLIDQQFDLQNIYKIFCGVAHCDTVTVSQLGFETLDTTSPSGMVKRLAVNHDVQRMLLGNAVAIYARAVWLHMAQYGCDLADAAKVLEEAFSRCGLNDRDEVRFWRKR
jgi:hypothetical protein